MNKWQIITLDDGRLWLTNGQFGCAVEAVPMLYYALKNCWDNDFIVGAYATDHLDEVEAALEAADRDDWMIDRDQKAGVNLAEAAPNMLKALERTWYADAQCMREENEPCIVCEVKAAIRNAKGE